MPILSPKDRFTSFPPLDIPEDDFTLDLHDKHDSPIDFGFSDQIENEQSAMAGASPYIKSEPNDYPFDLQQAMQYGQGQNFGTSNSMNINPASLSNGGFNQNMSSSFNMGNSGIADDELLDLQIEGNSGNNFDFNQGFLNTNMANSAQQFSHTPDGAPIQSPFTHDFNYAQFRNMQAGQQFANARSLPQQAGFRPQVQDQRTATPNTPQLTLHTPDYHPGMRIAAHRQRPSLGGGSDWDGTPSGHSWNESSPFPSPANGHGMQRQISEVLNQNAHKVASSLPAKMEPGLAAPGMQTQEAKRRRRRESHNMVERRRRDNINERIQDLGALVPGHRLEDERVRKYLTSNAPLSPAIQNAIGISPPNAGLLPSGARRGAGNITQGLPVEEKDKGPNKGDILNGSVSWLRDLLWYINEKQKEEKQLKESLSQLGQAWPFTQTEEMKRMSSEIAEILSKANATGDVSKYTRGPGSGLVVKGFTDAAGQATGQGGADFNGSVSPGFAAGNNMNQNNFQWDNNTFSPGTEFKEEDEYDMEV